MFSRLLKHEWRSSSGLLTILSLCALGVGLLGGGLLRAITYLSQKMEDNPLASLTLSGLSSIMTFVVLALVAYVLAVQFITVFRFYKNKFTDEGYLTFTLPVSVQQIFLSSFLNILIWLVISVVVLLISGGLIIFLGDGQNALDSLRIILYSIDSLKEVYPSIPGFGWFIVLGILQVIVAPVYAIVLLMTSITLGCVLAKKHKILATIGVCYGIHMVVGVLESVISIFPAISLLAWNTNEEAQFLQWLCQSMGLSVLLQLGLAVGGYFLSTWLMEHKLNLP